MAVVWASGTGSNKPSVHDLDTLLAGVWLLLPGLTTNESALEPASGDILYWLCRSAKEGIMPNDI